MLLYNKIIHRAFLLAALVALFTACSKAPDLSGKWLDQQDKVNGLRLDKEGYAWFVNGDKEAGGERFLREDGKEMQMKYELDAGKSPMWLDLVLVEKATGKEESRRMCIINLMDKNTMELMMGFATRDTKFDKASNGYSLLKREEE
jgi:hypothetical protein